MNGLDHTLVDCEDIGCEGCSRCTVCDGFEGELLTWCPGHKLNHETLDACYRGNVIDLASRLTARRRRTS